MSNYGRLYDSFEDAFAATSEQLSARPEMTDDVETIQAFATLVLAECFPTDLPSLDKLWWFPILEAGLELEYSVFFAKGGIYKVAYICLRNFLELSLVCFSYLIQVQSKGKMWVKGQLPTPFKREIIKTLFSNPDFQHLDQALQLKDTIDRLYGELSDICHTRGRPCSHIAFSKSNCPRMTEESLEIYIRRAREVIDLVITCFVGVNPIILFPLPIEEKYGLNGPMGGYLEECQVNILYKLLRPESISYLTEYYESNPTVVSIREYFEGLPSITEEEIERQHEEMTKMIENHSVQSMDI